MFNISNKTQNIATKTDRGGNQSLQNLWPAIFLSITILVNQLAMISINDIDCH